MPPRRKKPPAHPSGTSKIRIIGGQWRGRKLAVPELDGLRPTGDRLRETLFNWLMPYINGAHCLDAFAGTGALGLEALSRGAAAVQFIERDRAAAAGLRANLALLDCRVAEVAETDCLQWLSAGPARAYDLVFIDPPFAANLWQAAITRLAGARWLADDALVYVEAPRAALFSPPAGWQLHRELVCGQVCARLYKTNSGDAG